MSRWTSILARLGYSAENTWDRAAAMLRRNDHAPGARRIVPYDGHGATTVTLRGRVLTNPVLPPATDLDRALDNALAFYRRLASDETPGAAVVAAFNGATATTVTDEEGYFQFTLPGPPPPARTGWHEARLALADHPDSDVTARVLVPAPTADFGVISDIDDTVLPTHATRAFKMAVLLLLHNARTRLPFPGVAEFYTALQAGASGVGGNPIFYVSSGPWNLYDFLVEFMTTHDVPRGPLFLQDFGIDASKFIIASHGDHKLAQIEHILTTYPDLSFVLIGDSGQKDPEIYAETAARYPGRVRAIYIRDVSGAVRDAAVLALADKAAAAGVPMQLVADTAEAARGAAELGLIAPAAQEAIETAVAAAADNPIDLAEAPEDALL